MNFVTIDQSAAAIQLRSQSKQSKVEDEFSAGNFSCLDLTIQLNIIKRLNFQLDFFMGKFFYMALLTNQQLQSNETAKQEHERVVWQKILLI